MCGASLMIPSQTPWLLAGLVAVATVLVACSSSESSDAADQRGPATMAAEHARNRLSRETSPYLLQHATNPVDWYPWGAEAFARAAAEDKPVFLSIGYSTCHWCHVMAHESFEDAEVAAILNAGFIAIKVDREERPDVDEIYMRATQAFTGRGGWPNSVWLTPDGRPWYAGTYFPREDRQGQMGFKSLLRGLTHTWQTRRDDVEAQADELAAMIRRTTVPTSDGAAATADRAVVDSLIAQLARTADARHGGFGGAPKFPPHGSLRVLLYEHRTRGDAQTLALATATLDAMAAGGDSRPRRRGLPPLLDRCRVVHAPFREDALRQRPTGPQLRRRLAGYRE